MTLPGIVTMLGQGLTKQSPCPGIVFAWIKRCCLQTLWHVVAALWAFCSRQLFLTSPRQHQLLIRLCPACLAACVPFLTFRDSPDFTKTSQDGYTFDTYWEGRMIAKDIVSKHTESKQPHMRKHRHHDHMDAEEVMASFHAT